MSLEQRESNPNAFYYRNLDPGEPPSKGKWKPVSKTENKNNIIIVF